MPQAVNLIQRLQVLPLICLFSVTLLAHANLPTALVHNQQISVGKIPAGLSASDWGSIQEQINAGKYRVYPSDTGGYHSANPAQGWQIHYGTNGTTTLTARDSNRPTYHLDLKLSAIGYQTLQSLDYPQQISSKDNSVSYHWNDTIKEWWVNSDTNLEQWFSLTQRPAGAASGQPLTLQMTLNSTLSTTQHGNSIRFTNPDGSTNITYNKLKVWDANQRELSASMHLAGNILRLIIDDQTATYPLTIDPSFEQQAYIKASNTGNGDQFGHSVALSGNTLVVGAPDENSNAKGVDGDQTDNSADDAGAAYVFIRNGNTWSQQAYLKASNTEANDSFGQSVALSGDTLVVGANREDSNARGINGDQSDNSETNAGAAYVFTRSNNTWSQQAYLKASNANSSDQFSFSMALSGNTLVVGARFEGSNATGINGDQSNQSAGHAGAVYVFTRSGNTWSQQAYIKASNTQVFDRFGESVALSGNTLVVGAIDEASNATGVNGNQADNSATDAGAAYVFTHDGNIWSQQAYLKASNTGAGDEFGHSVSISGDTLVVGAVHEASNASGVNSNQADDSAADAGAAYVFTRNGSTWSQQAYLKASNAETKDRFGQSVALFGNTLVVGANHEASNATGVNGDQTNNLAGFSGAAYVFTRMGNTWSQQDYIKASNTRNEDFGFSVALSGNTLVVGADSEDSNATGVNGNQSDISAQLSGAAYALTVPGFTITANVSGLPAGDSIVLQNNAGDEFTVSANGDATFATALVDGSNYTVTVLTQPTTANLTCSVTNGNGILAGANVNNISVNCTAMESTLDADGNASVDALTDGLLFIRHMFGSRGESLIVDAVANNCTQCSAAELDPILEQFATDGTSDIDNNGDVDALTDGLLIIRYLFGIRGEALISDSVGDGCSRCTAVEIEGYLQRLVQ